MEPLKLIALDAQDLGVISAHLQDAVVRAEDLVYLPRERRFALALRRFDWEAPEGAPPRRRLAALHFERVAAARRLGVEPGQGDQVLNLLAVMFDETQAPSGLITLVFSGGAAVRLEVECIEAQLKDLGPMWEAVGRPAHGAVDEDK